MNEQNSINSESLTIELDSSIYDEAKSISEANPSNFPSMQVFINTALRNYIRSIKYNIESVDFIISKETGNLIPSTRCLTLCIFCSRTFLKEKSKNKESDRICQSCRQNILFFSKLLEHEDPDFKNMKDNFIIEEESG
ncbi:MAG: hypothetical protein Q7R87_01505 [Nanoarchaeota archaeon]|nr:hypothetical protein [Nanoarchaeota archaeon]